MYWIWYLLVILFLLLTHGLQLQSSPRDIYRHQGIELYPDLTCALPVWSDICLKEVPSIADSLYNIQLLREFATEYLNKSCYLTTEDMLYSPLVLKVKNVTDICISKQNSNLKFKYSLFFKSFSVTTNMQLSVCDTLLIFLSSTMWWCLSLNSSGGSRLSSQSLFNPEIFKSLKMVSVMSHKTQNLIFALLHLCCHFLW